MAFTPEELVLAALAIPFAGAALIPVFHRSPNLRETVTLTTAALLFVAVVQLLHPVLSGARP
jgi:multicomponent Na+:H+ antiporter subunit D